MKSIIALIALAATCLGAVEDLPSALRFQWGWRTPLMANWAPPAVMLQNGRIVTIKHVAPPVGGNPNMTWWLDGILKPGWAREVRADGWVFWPEQPDLTINWSTAYSTPGEDLIYVSPWDNRIEPVLRTPIITLPVGSEVIVYSRLSGILRSTIVPFRGGPAGQPGHVYVAGGCTPGTFPIQIGDSGSPVYGCRTNATGDRTWGLVGLVQGFVNVWLEPGAPCRQAWGGMWDADLLVPELNK